MLQGRDVYTLQIGKLRYNSCLYVFSCRFQLYVRAGAYVRMGQALLESVQYDGSPGEDT